MSEASNALTASPVAIAPVAALLAALRSTVNDDRGSPEECLRRAAEILQSAGQTRKPAREQEADAAAGAPPSIPILMRGGLAPWQVRTVRTFIEDNLSSAIRSADLARMVRLTPCHFIRAFRNSFGDSPIEYVIRLRIRRAAKLMLSTAASLSEIALECGFSDQAYLCRLFRRVMGDSPGNWRRARINPLS
jgi:AraC family transcriptional regulator